MRALLIEKLYEFSKKPYQRFFKKNEAWPVSIADLIHHEEASLGFHLGCFLLKYDFQIQPQLEAHDIYHVLTNTGISVPEEIGMQYFLLGNGKKSAYLFLVIVLGTFFYPGHLSTFRDYYRRGKQSHRFYDLHFLKMLTFPIKDIQYSFNIQ